MNLLDLSGRVAIVTGAAKGIGRGCAEVLAAAGAHVVVADIDSANGESTAAAINDQGGSALFVHTDVRSSPAVEAMVAAAVERWERLDVLVNNAGWHNSKGLLDCTEADWDSILDLNLKSVFLCSKAAFPALKETRGAIISIGSMVGLIGQKDSVAYTASKGAIISMTRSLALDVAPYGIRANCICPGVVDTPTAARVPRDAAQPRAAPAGVRGAAPAGADRHPDRHRARRALPRQRRRSVHHRHDPAGRRRRDTRLLGRPPMVPPLRQGDGVFPPLSQRGEG